MRLRQTQRSAFLFPPPKAGTSPRIVRIAGRAAQRKGLVLRALHPFHQKQDVQIITFILNEAMADNWGYIPLTFREVHDLANYCLVKGDPSLALIITVEKNRRPFPCACRQAAKVHTRAWLFWRSFPNSEGSAWNLCCSKERRKAFKSTNTPALEISQVDENNTAMTKIIASFSCPLIKRHRVYEKNITCLQA